MKVVYLVCLEHACCSGYTVIRVYDSMYDAAEAKELILDVNHGISVKIIEMEVKY